MKQKLLAALEQRYGGALGSKNEIYEKVVTAYGNLITSEEQIPDIVAGVEPLLKTFQSQGDKLRAFENKQKPEPTPQPSDNGNNPPEPKPEPKPDTPDIADIVAKAVAAAINPLQEKLTAFEAANAQKSAVAALDELKSTWDYAKGYPDESEYAYNMAMGIYNGIGKTWTAEQLTAKYKETFNERVSKKGVDTSKPFPSDGGAGGEADLDMTEVMKIYQKSGRVAGKE